MNSLYAFTSHSHIGDMVICAGAVRNVTAAFGYKIRFKMPEYCREVFLNNRDFVESGEAVEIGKITYGSLDDEQHGRWGNLVKGFTRTLCILLGIEQVPIIIRTPLLVLTDQEREEARQYEGAIIVNANCQNCSISKGYPHWQKVVDGLDGRRIIQVGGREARDISPDLQGVEDMRGKTSLRKLFTMVQGCAAVLSPPSAISNVAGAFHKKQVVVNASREPDCLIDYPGAVHVSRKSPCGWGVDSGCISCRLAPAKRGCGHPVWVDGRQWCDCQAAIDPDVIIKAAKGLLNE